MNSDTLTQERFGGIRRLYGKVGAEHLRRAHICVVGLGGVGAWSAEALARSGVEQITLIDADDICSSNINRQIHADSHSVGCPKVNVMAARIAAINPNCQVQTIEDFLTEETLTTYINPNMDYVLDAIDSAGDKAKLIAFCHRNKIPVITTGAAGGQIDPTQINTTDLSRTQNDPLAAKVRGILRRHYGFSKNCKRYFSVPCVYSREQLRYPQPDGHVGYQKTKHNSNGTRLDCTHGFGASTMVTATFGFVAAAYIANKIANKNG